MHPLAVFGLWPQMRRERHETIIAVNFGDCVVPTGLAAYELLYLLASSDDAASVAYVAPALPTR
jgi:uncharacterized membrane protein